MANIRKPAVKIQQGKRVLFLTAFTVKDFLRGDFYRVDRLDVKKAEGMQRLLKEPRVKSFGRDIIDAIESEETFLPTSVFLATSGSIGYDESKREIFFDSSPDAGICPLDIVDGQHRIEGMKWVVNNHSDGKSLQDFPIATVIAPNFSEAEKMLQFVVVNTKQERVDQGVTQHIIARFTQMYQVEKIPHLPRWLKKAMESGDVDKALSIVKALNDDADSPWHNRIRLADEQRSPNRTVTQKAFVNSVKKHLLVRNHPLHYIQRNEQQLIKILKNFWKAVNSIFVDEETEGQTVVFKTTGLDLFHAILAPVMNRLAKEREYTTNAFEKCINSATGFLAGDATEIMSADFWRVGSTASGLNRGATGKLAKAFADALADASNDDIKV